MLRLRFLGRRLLATWLCLLRRGAGRWAAGRANLGRSGRLIDQIFLARNQVRQEELRQVFAPYHRFCPECGGKCCKEGAIPYSDLDRILYGNLESTVTHRSPGQGLDSIRLRFCLNSRYLYQKLRHFSPPPEIRGESKDNGGQCPAWSPSGCLIPWGRRPAVCVLCACPTFLQAMSWPDFGRYFGVSLKYLAHLTRSLKALLGEDA